MQITQMRISVRIPNLIISFLFLIGLCTIPVSYCPPTQSSPGFGIIDAHAFGFLSFANGMENMRALQAALEESGTIMVSKPGTYRISGTGYIGSHTSLHFGIRVPL
ncbi:hypothetical protein [Pleomorphovibrio marinus]|uniref:hypothetical protein n=1 Tax=Pleomorphovibrio marinus TaxID=2164132 RepID=UPI001300638E|nr:hypothetical protein [Pleomorphovibrio marinus]